MERTTETRLPIGTILKGRSGSLYRIVGIDETWKKYTLVTDHWQDKRADWSARIDVPFHGIGLLEVVDETA